MFLHLQSHHDGTHAVRFKIPDLHAAILRKALDPRPLARPPHRRDHRRGAHQTALPRTARRGVCATCSSATPPTGSPPPAAPPPPSWSPFTLDHLRDRLGLATLDDGTTTTAAPATRLHHHPAARRQPPLPPQNVEREPPSPAGIGIPERRAWPMAGGQPRICSAIEPTRVPPGRLPSGVAVDVVASLGAVAQPVRAEDS
jgi:hypothetical protein